MKVLRLTHKMSLTYQLQVLSDLAFDLNYWTLRKEKRLFNARKKKFDKLWSEFLRDIQ